MKSIALLVPLLALAACTRGPSAQPESAPAAPVQATESAAATAAPAAPAPATPATPPPLAVQPNALARTDGYGDLRLGMSEQEARTAWGGELKGDAIEEDNCGYLRPKADQEFRTGFMFERGVLVRYDVAVDSETAPGGGRVGQQRADIERLYAGRMEVQPHHYVQGGTYLRVTDASIAGGALVFETDENGRVTRWRVGRVPQVDYVEGCS